MKKGLVTVIKRSCITGKIVWIYRGPSENAARIAYYRARNREIERVKHWDETCKKRADSIMRLLSNCMAKLPINAQLTKEQEEAARELKAAAEMPMPCHTEFYEHIIEEARRANEASGRWRANRVKMFGKKEMNKK